MASKSIDWDELLLTNDPKKKEIEVSFKKIDGEFNSLSFGDEPGTPGGTIEGDGGTATQFPDKDDEGNFIPIDPDEDGSLGAGDPVDPVEPFEQCEPQDCAAYDDYVDPPNVSSALLWGTQSGFVSGDIIPGCSLRSVGNLGASQGYPLDDATRSQFRTTDGIAGPCGQPATLYAINNFTSNASDRRWVPDEVYDTAASRILPGEQLEIQGALSVYLWLRNLDGTVPTVGSKFAGLIRNTCFAWGDDTIGTAPGVGTAAVLISVHQNGDNGEVYFLVNNNDKYLINNSGDASGAYTMSFNNTITRSNDGEGIFVTSVTEVSGKGLDLKFTQTNALETGVNGCWSPELRSKSGYPYYFPGSSGNPVITGASHGGTANQLNEWVTKFERAQQEYVPPDYCSRIP